MGKPTKPASNKEESVKVVVRCRPLSANEVKQGCEQVVFMDTRKGLVEVRGASTRVDDPPKTFTFDAVYDLNTKQQDIYNDSVRPIVDSVLSGYNGTVFAYGQTGTGKTHTMEGPSRTDPDTRGVIPNSFHHIFTDISRTHDIQFLVRASYLEIYKEDIRDLLGKDQAKKLQLKEKPDTGVYVKDLTSIVVKSAKEIDRVMSEGNKNRSVGATKMNEHSSRSHAIFIITIERAEAGADQETHIRAGKLNLVDLAGSERQSKTEATGDRLDEARKINWSLTALGNVINALVDGKNQHVPYRDTRLTRLLQDSLGGNAKTVMIANIGPANYNTEETLSTLRFANRAKNIKNKPKINEDPKDALLREFQDEISRLKAELEKRRGGGGGGGTKTKKPRSSANREEFGSDDSDDEEGEEGGEDEDDGPVDERTAEEILKEEEAKLEKERQSLLQNKTMIEEEKQRVATELAERSKLLQKEYEERNAVAAKLKAIESKLLVGGVNIFDRTNQQERELEQKARDLEDKRRRERDLQQRLEARNEEKVDLEGKFGSLQEEVDGNTKKLKKLWAKVMGAKGEIDDLQEEFKREREDLLQTTYELSRELKLKSIIIDNFIPPEEVVKIEKRAIFDEEKDEWVLVTQAHVGHASKVKRPMSAVGHKRPVSEYARMASAMGDRNPRYKAENILQMELDMPDRTTMDYEGPQVAPRVQAALDAALQDEEEVTVEARRPSGDIFSTTDPYLKGGRSKSRAASAKPSTSKKSSRAEPEVDDDDDEDYGRRNSASRGGRKGKHYA
eukprot:Opistho-2@28502